MANSELIGHVKCPICGNDDATVHEQKTGTKKGRWYYRCYTSPGASAMRCGTIQCIGPTGQEYLKANIRPIGQNQPETQPETPPPAAPAVEPVQPIVEPEKPPAPTPEPPAKRSGLLGLLFAEGDDE